MLFGLKSRLSEYNNKVRLFVVERIIDLNVDLCRPFKGYWFKTIKTKK